MRCGRHPYEGGVGVCAPCLRQRLLALAAAQNEASALPLPPPEPEHEPDLAFPRSASPYACRRKSDASAQRGRLQPGLLFFRTPQVGPAFGGGGGGFEEGDIGFRRRGGGRLSALFGGRHSVRSGSGQRSGDKGRTKHRSWFAGIMPRSRRNKEDETASPPSPPRPSCRAVTNRGLSPLRYADGGGEESISAAESPWLPSPSPIRKTPCRGRPGGAGTAVTGFSVCISPLVRPSSSRHHRGGHLLPDAAAAAAAAASTEVRPSPLHQLTSRTSLHHCRSWKLADGGRFR